MKWNRKSHDVLNGHVVAAIHHGCRRPQRVSWQPRSVPAAQLKFHLICWNSQRPAALSVTSSVTTCFHIRSVRFSYSRSVPGFYQIHLSHFPRCPRAAFQRPLRISDWLFPYITVPQLHHILLPLWLLSTKNPTYFFSTQSSGGHGTVLDVWPPNSCGSL